jgi:hypothetical protein
MTLSITIAELRAHRACDLADRIAAMSAHLGRTPEDTEAVPLAVWAEVTGSTEDLLWALRCCWDRGSRAVGVEVACRAADRAMIHARPDDVPVLRAAVDAARGCIAETVTEEACRYASSAVASAVATVADAYAVYAAYAAYSAACAAYTVYAAACAADAAACAARAARAARAADAADAADAAERAAQRADLFSLLEAT